MGQTVQRCMSPSLRPTHSISSHIFHAYTPHTHTHLTLISPLTFASSHSFVFRCSCSFFLFIRNSIRSCVTMNVVSCRWPTRAKTPTARNCMPCRLLVCSSPFRLFSFFVFFFFSSFLFSSLMLGSRMRVSHAHSLFSRSTNKMHLRHQLTGCV